jgi:predicted oxidoreductase (fatty acid repression mutant protein)
MSLSRPAHSSVRHFDRLSANGLVFVMFFENFNSVASRQDKSVVYKDGFAHFAKQIGKISDGS